MAPDPQPMAGTADGRPPHIFLICGEPSGDVLGGALIRSLRERFPDGLTLSGVGGPRMADAGLKPIFPMSDIALFGISEILPRIRTVMHRLDQATHAILADPPDVLVTIDAPAFGLRVGSRVRQKRHVPIVHYVAPTVWAWQPQRAKRLARSADHLMTLFPFEPAYFEAEGLPTSFVGHPVVEAGIEGGDGARFRATHGIDDSATVLTVLPGSRQGEVLRLLPVFKETVRQLAAARPQMVIVVPTVATVEAVVRQAVEDWPLRTLIVTGDQAKYDGFAASTAALACSGTVALELALARLPAVIAYRLNPITAAIVRRMVKVRFANLVNLMHDRMVVPECLQEQCTPDRLATEVNALLDHPARRDAQIAAYEAVAGWLGAGTVPPSRRAADVVARVLTQGRALSPNPASRSP